MTGHRHEYLSAALVGMVYVPVIAAARGECHVKDLCRSIYRQRTDKTLAREVSGESGVRLADRKHYLPFELRTAVVAAGIGLRLLLSFLLVPYPGGQTECRPRLGPAGIERYVRYDIGYLAARDSVVARRLQVVGERRVGYPLTDKRGNRYQAAVAQSQIFGAAPNLAEEYIVVEAGELRREVAQSIPARGLLYSLLCFRL